MTNRRRRPRPPALPPRWAHLKPAWLVDLEKREAAQQYPADPNRDLAVALIEVALNLLRGRP